MSPSQKWGILFGFLLVGILIYILSPVLTPFFIAALLAYLGDPLVNRMAKIKIPRTLGVIIVFFMIILLLLLLMLLLVPLLERQILLLIDKIPVIFIWVQNIALPWISEKTGVKEFMNLEQIQGVLKTHWQQAGNLAGTVIRTVTYSGYSIFVFLLNLVLIPIVTFYLLRDWDKVVAGIHRVIPRAIEPLAVRLARDCNEVIGAFFRGQLLVMLSLGLYYSLGLSLVGLQLALLIGIIVGFVSVVPYLGFVVGVTLTTIATLVQYHDWLHLGYVAVVFGIGHILENYILAPWLVGDRIGLHPVAVIFAVLAGGQLYGFIGILLALPVAAVIMVLVRYATERYLNSKLYKKASGHA